MPTVTITGGTGFIGPVLGQALLEKGYNVIVLSRQSEAGRSVPGLNYANWDISKQYIEPSAISSADHIIHLAGANVAEKRWTAKRKQEIVESRVKSGKLIVDSLRVIPNKVKTVVSASAIGWYGPDPVIPNPAPFQENMPPDSFFLGETCRLWEESIDPVTELGIRSVKIRTGIVLGKGGGALREFIKPMKAGVAAILGNGKQIISWIHLDDLVKMYIHAIEHTEMNGSYNAVAPHPVSNKELTLTLAGTRKKLFIPVHVPTFVLKMMLGEMSIEVLKSATVSSLKIQKTSFVFDHAMIGEALSQIVS